MARAGIHTSPKKSRSTALDNGLPLALVYRWPMRLSSVRAVCCKRLDKTAHGRCSAAFPAAYARREPPERWTPQVSATVAGNQVPHDLSWDADQLQQDRATGWFYQRW